MVQRKSGIFVKTYLSKGVSLKTGKHCEYFNFTDEQVSEAENVDFAMYREPGISVNTGTGNPGKFRLVNLVDTLI